MIEHCTGYCPFPTTSTSSFGAQRGSSLEPPVSHINLQFYLFSAAFSIIDFERRHTLFRVFLIGRTRGTHDIVFLLHFYLYMSHYQIVFTKETPPEILFHVICFDEKFF